LNFVLFAVSHSPHSILFIWSDIRDEAHSVESTRGLLLSVSSAVLGESSDRSLKLRNAKIDNAGMVPTSPL